jgi:hypothetical protein
MAEYQLYCFAQSGNAYRAALMLNLIGADWQPIFVDFFKAGVQRTAEYRSDVNEIARSRPAAPTGQYVASRHQSVPPALRRSLVQRHPPCRWCASAYLSGFVTTSVMQHLQSPRCGTN